MSMNDMKKTLAVFAAITLIATPLLASSRTKSTAPEGHNGARAIVVSRMSTHLSPDQISVLSLIAHASGAALSCEAIDLNEEAVKGGIAAVINQTLPDIVNDADRQGFRDLTLVEFGALVGLVLDEAAEDNAKFCALAVSEMSEEGHRTYLKPHSGPKPST